MATPLIRELRLAYPAATLDVLVMQGPVARDMLAGNPNVSEVMLFNFMKASKLAALRFVLGLRQRRYDLLLLPMPQNRLEYNLIAWLIGARCRIGFEYAIRDWTARRPCLTRTIPERLDLHVVENNLRLLPEGLGMPLALDEHRLELPLAPERLGFAERWLAGRGLAGRRRVGFHPGSGTTKNLALRRWDPGKWAELAKRLVDRCPDAAILLFGAGEEKGLRREIIARAGLADDVLMEAETGSVLESAALIKAMHCFVCCDTLLTHVAAAVGCPTVEILGPTDPRSIYPYGVPHRVVRTGIGCSPCYGYSRRGIRCTNEVPMACLRGVTPGMVLDAVMGVLRPEATKG